MSTHNRKKRPEKKSGISSVHIRRTDYLSVLPMLLMICMTFLILLMDLSMPEMSDQQYTAYPSMYNAVHILILLTGFAWYLIHIFKYPSELKAYFREHKAAYILLLLFIFCILVSTILNGFGPKALYGVSYRNIGIFHIITYILIYTVLSANISSKKLKEGLILSFIGVSDLLSISVLLDMFVFQIPAFHEKKDLSCIFFNGNHYGYFLVMAVLAAFGMFLYSEDIRIRVVGGISLLLNICILAVNGSVGCMSAVAAVMLLSLVLTHRYHRSVLKTHIYVLALIFACALIYIVSSGMLTSASEELSEIVSLSPTAGHNRMLLWETTVSYISEKPLFGYGCEGLSDILMDTLGRANPHNEILSYAAQFGVPAALFYVFGTVLYIKTSSDACESASLMAAMGYFISSLFGVPMFYTLPFFFIFLGISSPFPGVTDIYAS